MRKVLKWLLIGLLFAAAGGMATWSFLQANGYISDKGEKDEKEDAYKDVMEGGSSDEVEVERTETGETIVKNVGDVAKVRMGIEVKPVMAATRKPEITAYGQLLEDPAAGYTLRSPIPGVLRGDEQKHWPHIGEQLKSGAVVGAIEPRLSPVERADLASRLATARAEVEEAKAGRDAARISYDSKKKLNVQDQGLVSLRVVEEAEAKLRSEEAKLKAAEQNVRVFESSLTATSGPAGLQPLPTVARDGQVVQVTAQPGEAVDTNQVLLQLTDFHQLMARIDFPVGEVVPAGAGRARIVVAGHDDQPLDSETSALAASAESKSNGASLLFHVSTNAFVMQPGMPVTAYVELPGEAAKGFLIPRSAIVRFGGKAWVYVQSEDDQYTRREVSTERATAGGMFVTQGFTPEDRVAARGGQALLAAELSFSSSEKEEE